MEIEYLGKSSFNKIQNQLQLLNSYSEWKDITEECVHIGYKVNPQIVPQDLQEGNDIFVEDENSIAINVVSFLSEDATWCGDLNVAYNFKILIQPKASSSSNMGLIAQPILSKDFVGKTIVLKGANIGEEVVEWDYSIQDITVSEVLENGLTYKQRESKFFNEKEQFGKSLMVSQAVVSFHYNQEYKYKVVYKDSVFTTPADFVNKMVYGDAPFSMIGQKLSSATFSDDTDQIRTRWPQGWASFIVVPVYEGELNGNVKSGLRVEYYSGDNTKHETIVDNTSYQSIYGQTDYLIIPKVKGATQSDYLVIGRIDSAFKPVGVEIYEMTAPYRQIVDRVSDVDYRIRELEKQLNAT